MRAPINRLPSDVFRQIMLYLKDYHMPLSTVQLAGDKWRHPSLGSWHRASGVCRRWRQETLNMQSLWTTISVSDVDTLSMTSAWLTRSGTLPLTIVFKTHSYDDLRFSAHRPRADLAKIMSQKSRVRALGFYYRIFWLHLKFILRHFEQLETLMVMASNVEPGSMSCSLHQLRTLSMVCGTLWESGLYVYELRHLSLASQNWKARDVRAFLNILAQNPHLEEVMLDNVEVDRDHWTQAVELMQRCPRIPMQELKRLFIQERFCGDGLSPMAVVALHRTLPLEIPPACSRFYISTAADTTNLGALESVAYPVKRLAVTSSSLIGTDGVSVCIIRQRHSRYHDNREGYLGYIDRSQVQELWLQMPATYRVSVFEQIHIGLLTIKAMSNVVKLTVQRKVTFWLSALESSFPALQELHILMQSHSDGQAIIRFLKQRKQRGSQVDKLRFVEDSTSKFSVAFKGWKRNSWKFRCRANQVVFEDAHMAPGPTRDGNVALLSEGLRLPEVCQGYSLSGMTWRPWYSYTTTDT